MKLTYFANTKTSRYINKPMYDKPTDDFVLIANKLKKVFSKNSKLKVADIGCANGELLYYLQDLFPAWSLYGFDITKEFIAKAKSNKKMKKIKFQTKDIYNVKGNFDLVLCTGTLPIFPSPRKPLIKLINLCRKDGLIIIQGLFNKFDIDVKILFRDNTQIKKKNYWHTSYNKYSRNSIKKNWMAKLINFTLKI